MAVLNDAKDKGLPSLTSELWELVVTYLKQETLNPVRSLGRFVALGAAGAVSLGIGLVMLVLAGLRLLQDETGTALTGSLTWLPYVAMLVLSGLVALVALRAITAERRKGRVG